MDGSCWRGRRTASRTHLDALGRRLRTGRNHCRRSRSCCRGIFLIGNLEEAVVTTHAEAKADWGAKESARFRARTEAVERLGGILDAIRQTEARWRGSITFP